MFGKFASTDSGTEDSGTEDSGTDANTAFASAQDDAGVIHAVIRARIDLGKSGTLLRVALPLTPAAPPTGQFFLARPCPDDRFSRRTLWSLYARRPLYVADQLPRLDEGITEWSLLLPQASGSEDAGDQWLRQQPPGMRLNLTGPFGRVLTLQSHQRALLAVADLRHLPLCLPAIHAMLDQGGRATLILHSDAPPPPAMLQRIPIPVEVRIAASAQDELGDTLRWADVAVVALPDLSRQWLAQAIRMARFRLEPDFAHVFAPADYLCGYGACHACAVPSGDGFTRACVHGPFLALQPDA